MPHAFASEVPGIHNQPPDLAVVPPNLGSFSTTRTLRPCAAVVTAALIPEAPEPMTNASHSYHNCLGETLLAPLHQGIECIDIVSDDLVRSDKEGRDWNSLLSVEG